MAIKRNSINENRSYEGYLNSLVNENDSNPNNFSHQSNLPTNFNLKSITLEDCDQAVYLEFDKRFKIGENYMPIVLLDAELSSVKEQNFSQFDKDKNFLNGPFFTMIRKESNPKYRTNPSTKKCVYAIPITKANGVVFEEYIYDGPLSYELIYDFKFITNFREYSNKFEEQFRYYFRNRRNIIICSNERFSIGPVDANKFSTLELINSETINERTYYVSSYELKLECFVRDLSNMQKRERPNKISLSFDVKDEKGSSTVTSVDEFSLNRKPSTKNNPNGLKDSKKTITPPLPIFNIIEDDPNDLDIEDETGNIITEN